MGFPTPIPFLTFNLSVLTNKFVYRRKLDKSHQKTYNKILQLKNKGLGYRSISKELNRLGFKSSMGKDFYPSLVSVIWKKIEKKQRILNQPVVKEYSDFDIVLIQLNSQSKISSLFIPIMLSFFDLKNSIIWIIRKIPQINMVISRIPLGSEFDMYPR